MVVDQSKLYEISYLKVVLLYIDSPDIIMRYILYTSRALTAPFMAIWDPS